MSNKQLKIEEFKSDFELSLKPHESLDTTKFYHTMG